MYTDPKEANRKLTDTETIQEANVGKDGEDSCSFRDDDLAENSPREEKFIKGNPDVQVN